MSLTVERKLTGTPNKTNNSGAIDNANAVATFGAVAGSKNYIQQAIASYGPGVLGATSHRVTLTFTKDGVARTISFQLGSNSVVVLQFGPNPIEGDENTAITLTVPASGTAGVFGEACLTGLLVETT